MDEAATFYDTRRMHFVYSTRSNEIPVRDFAALAAAVVVSKHTCLIQGMAQNYQYLLLLKDNKVDELRKIFKLFYMKGIMPAVNQKVR